MRPYRPFHTTYGAGPAGRSSSTGGGGRGRASRMSADELDALFAALGQARFVAFDFETTGLSPATDRVVEIGAVGFRLELSKGAWKAVDTASYQTLVNPCCLIPPRVSAIHGIDDLAVASAPTFAQAAGSFIPFLDDSTLVAHNAPFDLGFLAAETARAGIENPPNPAYDTIAVAKTAVSGLPSYSLTSLAAAMGIVQSAAHRGADDARVCMELFVHCINLININK